MAIELVPHGTAEQLDCLISLFSDWQSTFFALAQLILFPKQVWLVFHDPLKEAHCITSSPVHK